jgi:hypothetical protein
MIRFWVLKSLLAGGATGGSIQAIAQTSGNGDPHTELLLGLFSMVGALGVAGITAFATITVSKRGERGGDEEELRKENARLRRELVRKERILSKFREREVDDDGEDSARAG